MLKFIINLESLVIKIDKKSENKIRNAIEKALESSMIYEEFDKNSTLLDFSCPKCKAKYSFDVMAIYFDSLYNREKFLVNPVCPICEEKENFNLEASSMKFLAYLYTEKLMPEAIFQEKNLQELTNKYPREDIIKDNLDDIGLNALEKGDYKEVFRIFTQFIYLNPNHHLGFEFISYAYYENREFEKALWFMEKAIERAEILSRENKLDKGLLSVLKKNYEYMKRRQLITRWWENL